MIYLLNKPANLSSNQALQKFKRKYQLKKAGYAGTLDPMATGLLIIGSDEDTKKLHTLEQTDKQYDLEAKFGWETDTLDATGNTMAEVETELTNQQVKEAVFKFVGKQLQVPPNYSAIRVDGRHLYEYARKNLAMPEIKPREVELINMDNFTFEEADQVLKLTILVTKGFYVRSLVRDIAKTLNTKATLTKLVRTKVGPYELKDSIELEN